MHGHPVTAAKGTSRDDSIEPGDPWFEDAVVDLLPDLMSAALRMAGNRPDAEDLVADTVARAWEKRSDLEDRDRFRGWLFRILTNLHIDFRRARKARPESDRLPQEADPAAGEEGFSLFEKLHQPFLLWQSSPETRFLDRLLADDLERAVDALPEEFRIVVVLADVQGFTYREIADTLDIPIGTVRSRLSRGRSRLQERLWRHAVDAGWREERERESDSSSQARSS